MAWLTSGMNGGQSSIVDATTPDVLKTQLTNQGDRDPAPVQHPISHQEYVVCILDPIVRDLKRTTTGISNRGCTSLQYTSGPLRLSPPNSTFYPPNRGFNVVVKAISNYTHVLMQFGHSDTQNIDGQQFYTYICRLHMYSSLPPSRGLPDATCSLYISSCIR